MAILWVAAARRGRQRGNDGDDKGGTTTRVCSGNVNSMAPGGKGGKHQHSGGTENTPGPKGRPEKHGGDEATPTRGEEERRGQELTTTVEKPNGGGGLKEEV